MGELEALKTFDAPFNLEHFTLVPWRLDSILKVVCGICKPIDPDPLPPEISPYPHFEFCVHSLEEENDRCFWLRTFLYETSVTLLRRCAGKYEEDGRYPSFVLAKAILQSLNDLQKEKILELFERSCFYSIDSDVCQSICERFHKLFNHLEKNRERGKKFRLENNILQLTKSINSKTRNPADFLEVEFNHWIEFHRKRISDVLEPLRAFSEDMAFNVLSPKIPDTSPKRRKFDKRHDRFRIGMQSEAVAIDFVNASKDVREEFKKRWERYRKALPEADRPTSRTVGNWRTPEKLRIFKLTFRNG